MAAEVTDPEVAARATLALLETRLHRLEYLLTGKSDKDGIPPPADLPTEGTETVWTSLSKLEAGLHNIRNIGGPAGAVVRDIEWLSSTHPDQFPSLGKASSDIPKSESLATLASIVLSHATLYPETASRLASLQTLQIPPADQSSRLMELGPRLEERRQVEEQLKLEIRDLRERSARCLEWWVKIGVVGMGDMWEDWEGRIANVERNVIRWERRAKEEQGYL